MPQVKLVQRKTVPRRWIERLTDVPKFQAPDGNKGWQGYEHFTDPTMMSFNKLTIPSQNCTIPSFDKIVPDKGKTLYGQEFTENNGINGNKERFKNLGGIEMEIREWSSSDTNLKDVIQIGYLNNRLVFTIISGSFSIGEVIAGQTSGATGVITSITGTVMTLDQITNEFSLGEVITGQTSGATATVDLVPETLFHSITELTNPLPRGAHEYYFDSWFDTNINPALSKNLPRAIWVNGYENMSTHKGEVYSWTGGVAVITSFTGTTISINPNTTWRSLGFTEDASGNASIIVNGIEYVLTNPPDLDTSTISVASTFGISIGDTATSKIEVDISPIPFDMCRQNKGYMYYGNWKTQQYYQSNAFNRPSSIDITQVQALQNDLVVSGTYTGSVQKVIKITIDSAAIPQESFTGTGINDIFWDISGYTPTTVNTYKVLMVSDEVVPYSGGSGTFVPGDIIIGSVTGAQAVVVFNNVSSPGNGTLLVRGITGLFRSTDTITGSSSGATANAGDATLQDGFQVFKNNTIQSVSPWGFTNVLVAPMNTPIPIIDGLTITFQNITGHRIGDYFTLSIGLHDTFSWTIDNVSQASNVIITGSPQLLTDGVSIQFNSTTGHTVGDFWILVLNPEIVRAWDNFYYALPIRRPGEGYIYQLPSAFWTMDTQEDTMYINGAYGEWSIVQTQLSADLQSEAISLTPLKQASANKVLYPYLTGHNNDMLVYINTEHSLDTLGRLPLIEKPQTGYLSDPVKLDFMASSFKGGRIKYFGKRLYVSSPEDGIMHVFDDFKKYWQPPKKFPEVGILTVIGNNIACHSNTRNQTFTLFTNSAGDNGQGYLVEMRTPYKAPSGRWKSSFSNMSFTEGYIQGNPKLIYTVYEGVNGCGGILPHAINPIICLAPDRAPFGEGSFGSHSFGSDLDIGGSYFNEIYKAYSPILQYYFIQIGLSCTAKSHTYSILTLGMNGMSSETGNNNFVNPDNLAINQV